jgi:large subunit ribosomal protein L19
MNILQEFERREIAKSVAKRKVPEFGPGDTLRVNFLVVEGTRERVQAFEGVCIARSGAGANASFTVRKISYGEGVERIFPLHSPRIASIDVIRRGDVRRAKLYFLRERRGKSARIAEKIERRLGIAGSGQPPATAREAESEIGETPQTAATAVQATDAPAGEPKLSKKERRAAKAEAAGKAKGRK